MNNSDSIKKPIAASKTAYEESKHTTEAERAEKLNSPRYDWFRQLCSALVLFGYLVGIHQVFSNLYPVEFILIMAGTYGIITFLKPPCRAKSSTKPSAEESDKLQP